jgi:hypothetical protein
VTIWVFDLDHHFHAHDLPNPFLKLDLKYDMDGRMHHLKFLVQDEVHKSLHVAPQMHAWEFVQTRHSSQ